MEYIILVIPPDIVLLKPYVVWHFVESYVICVVFLQSLIFSPKFDLKI